VIEFSYPSANEESTIHAFRMEPQGCARAVVQLAHGMAEHISRYIDFAQFLCGHGFVVVGNDHLGHGKTRTDDEEYGYFGALLTKNLLVDDMHTLSALTSERFSGVPYFILGHSMGSFLLREYITMYGKELAGAILMGTGSPSPTALSLGLGAVRLIASVRGERYRSRFVANLVDGSFNNRIENVRMPHDWISTVPSVVDAYEKDESTGFMFTMNGFEHMFINMLYVGGKRAFAHTPHDLPLLLISGGQDPVGGYGEQVVQVAKRYEDAGVTDVTVIMYPDDRHEVLNEVNKQQVYEDIAQWIGRYVDFDS
jgi:alpha-beta hydrolase superfamily lysophospholipase